jgi:uncharacterized phage protein (TIGR02218 family)
MKLLTANMKSHLEQEVTSLVTCWSLTRRDGVEMFFTDFDEDLDIDGDLYLASSGYSRTAVANSASLSVDNLDIIGALNSDAIAEADLMAGLYDFAEVSIFLVNWQDLSMGRIPLRTGWLGEISVRDGEFVAELRGLGQALLRQIGDVYTPGCTADLGDDRCTVDIEALTETDVVAAATDRRTVTLTDFNGADGVLAGGVMTFVTGLNAGRSMEIKIWEQGSRTAILFLDMPYDIAIGDEVSFHPGCDKSYVTCRDVYINHLNFRGFPHIPGTDALLELSHD